MTDIKDLGKGAVKDTPDARDYRLPMMAATVDWNTPFMLPEPPNENQQSSSSCVGQAWSYYHWQIRPKDYCRRDIYAWIFLPGGGAEIRAGGLRLINFGQDTRNNVQDPFPQTELAMENRTGLDVAREKVNRELDSRLVGNTIEQMALAIENFKGVVFGVIGTNPGWANMAMPRPPKAGETQWGHCLYLFGHHLHNGKKCVIAKSSWGTSGNTTVHHITEDYFVNNSFYIFNAWTLVPSGATSMDKGIMLLPDNKTEAAFVKIGAPIQSIDNIANMPDEGLALAHDGKTVIFYTKEGSQIKINELKDALEIAPGDAIVPSSSL